MKLHPLLSAALLLVTCQLQAESISVHNWSDYIAPGINARFSEQTGIAVDYSEFESNEALEAELLQGKRYDLVVPSHDFYQDQIVAGLYQEIDQEQLSNWKHLDPSILVRLSDSIDPDNLFGVPYMWGTTGIGFNPEQVRAALGDSAPVDSWALLFEPANLEKLAACGVAMIDSRAEIYASMLAYLGKDPLSRNPADYELAHQQLMKLRPYLRYVDPDRGPEELASGALCALIGFSGDILATQEDASAQGIEIAYRIPKEGASLWFDMLAIPADAPNPEAALKYLNFLLDPGTSAENANYIAYATPVAGALPLIDPALRNDPQIYPNAAAQEKLFFLYGQSSKVKPLLNRLWPQFVNGH